MNCITAGLQTRVSAAVAVHQRLYGSCRNPSPAVAVAVAARSTFNSPADLRQLCTTHGVHLAPCIFLAKGDWGLSLYSNPQAAGQQQSQQQQQQPCVSVPLDLVLSCSIPGCSPNAEDVTPELEQLLHGSTVSYCWEMQVAVLLLWALRQPTHSRVGGFWRQYCQLLPQGLQQCGSLLAWDASELRELQDATLQATAQQWQQTVRDAYHSAVQPYFNSPTGTASSATHSSSTINTSSSTSSHCSPADYQCSVVVSQPCSLEEWVWAVATVESRAFGAARADVAAAEAQVTGSEITAAGAVAVRASGKAGRAAGLTGLVPVLDLANHTPYPAYQHRVDSSTMTFSLFRDVQGGVNASTVSAGHEPATDDNGTSNHSSSCSAASGGGSQAAAGSSCGVHQVLITYGSKDNRQLMEQYGFAVPGNPHDRVVFPPTLLQKDDGWMSHKAVKAAAQQVLQKQRAEGVSTALQQPKEVLEARLSSAVASVLQYRGWRNAEQYRAATPEATVACAVAMLNWVQQELQARASTAAADSAVLQEYIAAHRGDPGRLLSALQYRLDQKLLLSTVVTVLAAIVNASGCQQRLLRSLRLGMAPKLPMRRLVERPVKHEAAGDDVVEVWKQQYPMPDEADEGSRADVKLLYRPPRNDVKGIAIACSLIAAWVLLFYHGCWQIKLVDAPDGSSRRSSWLDIGLTFILLEFVNTGLFITTHDAMHGTICYRNRRLNDLLGRIAITLYAYFDYDMLHKKHWEHHNFTGQSGKDPDFHTGNTNLFAWYGRFMYSYTTFLQIAKIVLASQVLQALGVPYVNLCVYMAAAPLLAAFRLFYFGTYLPHLPPDNKTIMIWQKSHSSDDPFWLTFLTCYHFGLHWEHHRWPYAPWWELPKAKVIAQQWKGQQRVLQQQKQEQSQLSQQQQDGGVHTMAH